MATVVCVGVAVLDRIFSVARLPSRSGKYFAKNMVEIGGGPAASAAVTVARLGGQAIFLGRVGGDTAGRQLLDEFRRYGVDAEAVRRVPEAHSTTAVAIVDAGGERMIVSYADPMLEADASWLPLERLASADCVLADVRWPEGAAAALDAARARDLPAVLDADRSPDGMARSLLPRSSHALFSEPGLAEVAGTAAIEEGLRRVAGLTDAWVGVTCGERGSYWLEAGVIRHLPAFRVEAVDTIGAGDVFHGAFALALAERSPVEPALRVASGAAALKCQHFGGRAGIPDRAAVERLLKERK